jgi:hypothetical protein
MYKAKLISLAQYRNKRFVSGSAPDVRTLKKMINEGELAGKQVGKIYYVEVDENNIEYDGEIARLLRHG